MSFWVREANGDNPHWLCLTGTAVPLVAAGLCVWAVGPVAPPDRPAPPETVAAAEPTDRTDLALARDLP